MRLGDDQIEFNFTNSMRYCLEVDCCWIIKKIDKLINVSVSSNLIYDPLKACLTKWMKKILTTRK